MTPRSAGHFLEARCTVLGFELHSFTLWHRRSLEVVRSPFMSTGPITFADLLLACRICAAEPCSPLRPLVEPTLRARLWARVLWLIFGRRWGREADLFEEYLELHEAGPRRTGNIESKGWALESPETLYLHRWLVKRHGKTEEEAWRISPGLARWHQAIELEVDGIQPGIRTREVLAEYLEGGHNIDPEDY